MQSAHRASKGKDRVEDGNDYYSESFASLSLSDCVDHHLATHTEGYTEFFASQSAGSSICSLAADDSYEPLDVPVHRLTPSSLASDHDNASVESYGSSGAGWSDSQSRGSVVSSTPSVHSARTDVNNTIHRQGPANERYQLPCEFYDLTGCNRVYPGDDVQGWMDHVEAHIHSKFPIRLKCWFCNEQDFDARETSQGDVRSNFNIRMQHIRDHIVYDGYRSEQMQMDVHLVNNLLSQDIVDKRTFESTVKPSTVRPRTVDVEDAIRSQRTHHSHRRFPQVEEKVVAESSSSRHRQQTELRISTWLTGRERGSQRVGRYREALSKRISKHIFTSAVDHPDDAGSGPLGKALSSLHFSSNTLKNIFSEGPKISTRNTAANKPFGNQNLKNAGNKTTTNTVVNDLHHINTGLFKKASRYLPRGFAPPQSHHSYDVPSSCQTDTPTTESDSFWLAEYSEEEDKRLDEDHPFLQFRALAVTRVFEAFRCWRETHSEQNIPCDGIDETDPAPRADKGKGKDTEKGKRKRTDHSKSENNLTKSGGPSSNRVGCSKRRRTSDRQLTFACPYTKKDPMAYRGCYKYKLSRIRDVKQHLIRCHRNPLYCPRCMGTFETEDERDEHIRESSCPLRSSTRIDGITESQRSRLGKKSAQNTSAEAQWFVVFDIVFPGHKPRPQSPYIDSELLQDITLYQDFLTSQGPRILSEVLTRRGAVTWNLPDEERDLSAFQQTVFEEGLDTIFNHWLARRSSSSQAPNAPSSIGILGQHTPSSCSNSGQRVESTSAHNFRAGSPDRNGSQPGGEPADAYSVSEDVQEASADQISFGEELDGSFNLEHGNSDFLSGLTYDGLDDELTRFFIDG